MFHMRINRCLGLLLGRKRCADAVNHPGAFWRPPLVNVAPTERGESFDAWCWGRLFGLLRG